MAQPIRTHRYPSLPIGTRPPLPSRHPISVPLRLLRPGPAIFGYPQFPQPYPQDGTGRGTLLDIFQWVGSAKPAVNLWITYHRRRAHRQACPRPSKWLAMLSIAISHSVNAGLITCQPSPYHRVPRGRLHRPGPAAAPAPGATNPQANARLPVPFPLGTTTRYHRGH